MTVSVKMIAKQTRDRVHDEIRQQTWLLPGGPLSRSLLPWLCFSPGIRPCQRLQQQQTCPQGVAGSQRGRRATGRLRAEEREEDVDRSGSYPLMQLYLGCQHRGEEILLKVNCGNCTHNEAIVRGDYTQRTAILCEAQSILSSLTDIPNKQSGSPSEPQWEQMFCYIYPACC